MKNIVTVPLVLIVIIVVSVSMTFLLASCGGAKTDKAELTAFHSNEPFPYNDIKGLAVGQVLQFTFNSQDFKVIRVKNGYVINALWIGYDNSTSSTNFISLDDF